MIHTKNNTHHFIQLIKECCLWGAYYYLLSAIVQLTRWCNQQ